MGNRTTERSALGAFDVDVDPLVVSGRFGKLIDALLADVEILAISEVFANSCFESIDSGNHSCGHKFSLVNDNERLRVPETLVFATLRM